MFKIAHMARNLNPVLVMDMWVWKQYNLTKYKAAVKYCGFSNVGKVNT